MKINRSDLNRTIIFIKPGDKLMTQQGPVMVHMMPPKIVNGIDYLVLVWQDYDCELCFREVTEYRTFDGKKTPCMELQSLEEDTALIIEEIV